MTLPLTGDGTVHLGPGTFMWVALTRFLIDPGQDNQTILKSLIKSPGYQHDYASPFPRRRKQSPGCGNPRPVEG